MLGKLIVESLGSAVLVPVTELRRGALCAVLQKVENERFERTPQAWVVVIVYDPVLGEGQLQLKSCQGRCDAQMKPKLLTLAPRIAMQFSSSTVEVSRVCILVG